MSLPIMRTDDAEQPVQPRREQVWTCGACHGQLFFLHTSGEVECATCGKFSDTQRCGSLH